MHKLVIGHLRHEPVDSTTTPSLSLIFGSYRSLRLLAAYLPLSMLQIHVALVRMLLFPCGEMLFGYLRARGCLGSPLAVRGRGVLLDFGWMVSAVLIGSVGGEWWE